MAKGTKATFGDMFGCTRRNPKKLQELGLAKVRPCYCRSCGYIEFYREIKKLK
ncbi:MAG: hypothetical protein JSV05_01005 [Candidatus Bathyarchaeota archaeon]|nr:MAG: hypothetical protein JSV05_01005 [Candidatus Bathyarchaeota archaeon]